MTTKRNADHIVVLSENVYRSLLALYPADYRREYGWHMTQVFRDVCRERYRSDSTWGLVDWWLTALPDLLKTVIEEHRKAGFPVSKAKFIQWSGWLLIFGGICFAASSISQLPASLQYRFFEVYQLSTYAFVPAMAFMTLGLIGVYLRYEAQMEVIGKLSVLAAIFGAGLASIGWLLTVTNAGDFWVVFISGWVIHLIGTSVFGGVAFTIKLLPKWNFAPLIGSGLPLTLLVFSLGIEQDYYGRNWGAFAMFMAISVSWIVTGWALNSRASVGVQPAPAM